MQATSHSAIAIDVEDYRRLGVRPFETRLSVIRAAATQTAKSLAVQQLVSPSEEVAKELSLVATSAYRLLDPRQRDDAIQRAHIGRILPNTLSWAGRTRFGDSHHDATKPTAFNWDSLIDLEGSELREIEESTRFEDDVQAWVSQLSLDHRSQSSARAVRWIDRIHLNSRVAWIALVVVSLIVGTLMGLATLRWSSKELTLDPSGDRDPSLSGTSPVLDASTTHESTTHESTTHESTTHESGVDVTNIDPSATVSSGESPASLAEASLETVATLLEQPVESSLLVPMASDVAPVDEAEMLLQPHAVEPSSPKIENTPASPPDTAPPRLHARPSKSQSRSARIELQKLLPELAQTPHPMSVGSQMERLDSMRQSFQVGTPLHWTAHLSAAELAWLVQSSDQVSIRLNLLHNDYAVPANEPLVEAFAAACGTATLPVSHQHLMDEGLRLADRLLREESFENGSRVIEALVPSAEILNSESSREALQILGDAVAASERLSQTSRRMLDELGHPLADSDLGILGRYQCLMLRRWETGLAWLTEASDPRIASAAKQEMALADSPTPAETLEVALLWLSIAERSEGRVADSIRSHAVDHLKSLIPSTKGLQKLRLQRAVEKHEQDLPSYLQNQVSIDQPPAANSVSVDSTVSESTSSALTSPSAAALAGDSAQPTRNRQGLGGQILREGRDLGVQLEYEMGVAFSGSLLDTVAERIGQPLQNANLRFQGQFELSLPTTISVVLAAGSQRRGQSVQIDDQLVEWQGTETKSELKLGAGPHQIVWSIPEVDQRRVSLQLRDALTGQPLSLTHSPRSDADASDADRRQILTVAIVGSHP